VDQQLNVSLSNLSNFCLVLTACTSRFRFLRIVDKFNFLLVSAFVTHGGKFFLLLHNGKSEDAVRQFFTDVQDIYVKHMVNPFSQPNSPIVSPYFDTQVRILAKRLLS
jgi:hypothetical protein